MAGSRPTIRDLAREAGVSRSTASRAVSGRGYVAPLVRARVIETAERLGYVPDAVARALRHRTSRAIGVLISDLRNPFYADVATAAEQHLRVSGYHIIVATSDGLADAERDAATLFTGSRVGGVLVAPVSPIARRLLSAGVEVVEIDRQMAGDCDAVMIENAAGADAATTHLLEFGHRRIGLLLGEMSWATGPERLAGYRAALARARVPFDEDLLQRQSAQVTETEHLARQLLDRRPDVTAIFATNNLMAEDAIAEVQRRGLSIPRDISLVAFDDVPWMSIVQPGITAVAQPTLEIGRTAVDLLLGRMAGTRTGEPTVTRLQPRLVIRGSAAPPKPPG